MQTGGLSNTKFFRPDFNNREIVIAQNLGNSRFGIGKMKNFSFTQQKSKFVERVPKILGVCLKKQGFSGRC